MSVAGPAAGPGLGEQTPRIETPALLETWDAEAGAPLPAGAKVGRYVLEAPIGAGGMGEVYRGYDPELDRAIAIKRLTAGTPGASKHTRLLREAQAIARLSHPNVVAVHDVGADEATGDVFIAMELVEGQTLRKWLATARSWRQIAFVFAEAAEGLLAAHARGIVHRDFKPENVLVTEDGHAKVVDFGLAKSATSADEDDESDDDDDPSSAKQRSALQSPLTQAGARVGTPAYMPPEQIAGQDVDPRADQFSFGAALYEALFGRLPFSGRTPEQYAVQVLGGTVRPVPTGTAVPSRLIQAIERTLRPEPDDRFSSLRPVVAELKRDRRKIWRRRLGVAALVAGGAAATLGGLAIAPPEDEVLARCRATAGRAHDVWNATARADLERALTGLQRPFADATAERTVAAVDDLARSWIAARRTSCEAETADTDPEIVALRTLCLDRNLLRQRDVIETLRTATAPMLEHVVPAVATVARDLRHCSEPGYLAQWGKQTEAEADPAIAESILSAWHLAGLGQVRSGLAYLDEHQPTEAWPAHQRLEWETLRAELLRRQGDLDTARSALESAAFSTLGEVPLTTAARWQDIHASTMAEQGEIEGLDAGYRRSHALYAKIFGPQSFEAVHASASFGHVPYARGEYERALELYRDAATQGAKLAARSDLDQIQMDAWVAQTLGQLGRADEAIAAGRDVIERLETSVGRGHPRSREARSALGVTLLRAGHSQQALDQWEPLLAQLEADREFVDPIDRATLLANIGAARSELEQPEAATDALRSSLDVLERHDYPADHPHVIAARANLGSVLNQQQRYEEAHRVLADALEAIDGDRAASSNALMIRFSLVGALVGLHRHRAAEKLTRTSIELAEQAGNQLITGRLYLRLGKVLDAQHRTAAADGAIAAARAALVDQPAAWRDQVARYENSRGTNRAPPVKTDRITRNP